MVADIGKTIKTVSKVIYVHNINSQVQTTRLQKHQVSVFYLCNEEALC